MDEEEVAVGILVVLIVQQSIVCVIAIRNNPFSREPLHELPKRSEV